MTGQEIDLCGLCGLDHEGQCPGTEPTAPYVDTRPRYPYRVPDGRVVQVIHDVGEQPRPTITYDLGGGAIVEGVLVDESFERLKHIARRAEREDALIALLWAWSDAADAGALRGASLQIFGDEAADTLETWAASRGVAVERRTLTPATALSSGVTEWPIVSMSLPGGGRITAHRGRWT